MQAAVRNKPPPEASAGLAIQGAGAETPDEPQRVITLRIPKSLHESLKEDAHNARTSMNQLCITRLLGLKPGQ
jgi:predicted HicB family RNase H-like nuclease